MSDAWEEIQAIKSKRNSLRERLEKRRKERQDILGSSLTPSDNSSPGSILSKSILTDGNTSVGSPNISFEAEISDSSETTTDAVKVDPELEYELLKALCEVSLTIPVTSLELTASLKNTLNRHASHSAVCNLLQKFATQRLINVKDGLKIGKLSLEVTFVEHTKLTAMVTELSTNEANKTSGKSTDSVSEECNKRKAEDNISGTPAKHARIEEDKKKESKKDPKASDIMKQKAEIDKAIDIFHNLP